MKLSELKKNDIVYVQARGCSGDYMTKENFYDSFQYDMWIENSSHVEVYETRTLYLDPVNAESVLAGIRKQFSQDYKSDENVFNDVMESNISLKYLADVVNKAILSVPMYEQTGEKIEIDIIKSCENCGYEYKSSCVKNRVCGAWTESDQQEKEVRNQAKQNVKYTKGVYNFVMQFNFCEKCNHFRRCYDMDNQTIGNRPNFISPECTEEFVSNGITEIN